MLSDVTLNVTASDPLKLTAAAVAPPEIEKFLAVESFTAELAAPPELEEPA